LRVIAIANQKGGCGKTTTSINFSACLHFLQKKVLLVDLDPQGHSTCGLGIKTLKGTPTIYELLSPIQAIPTSFTQVIRTLYPDFDIMPSQASLNALEEEANFMPNHHLLLKNLFARMEEQHRGYDFVILDCPPNLGILTWNALNAADEVIIPVEPSFFSLHGLGKISETVQNLDRTRQTPLTVHALLTNFNSLLSFSQEIHDDVRAHFKEQLFRTIIHENVMLKEAAAAGQSIAQYAPGSPAFQDYLNLAVEYLERDWDRKLPSETLGWDNVYKNRFGPKLMSDGILFQFQSKTASSVEVAGDFNRWVPESLVRRNDDGLWQKVIRVGEKAFRYKFIVDGEWQVDPSQPTQKENAYGGLDSYVEFV